MVNLTGIDLGRIGALEESENARFAAERPRSLELGERARRSMPRGVPMAWMDDLYDHPPVWVAAGEGAHFTDVDGHTYLDLYVADMSAFCGHAPSAVVKAVAARMALGSQFLLPGEDAIAVAEHLADRYRMPRWQLTLSGTQANTEVIRIARALTGRDVVLVFDGKYHGEGDATLVIEENGRVLPEHPGLPPWVAEGARVIQFNDVAALEAALADRDVALVLAEPAMTNAGFILPQPGYHEALRRATTETGTLLALDEVHTLVCSHRGLAAEWGLEPDFLTLGKSIAAGVPLAAYGMREEIAAVIAPPEEARVVSGAFVDEVPTGGTLFANALSLAAGRAALEQVLTERAFARTSSLGEHMAAGLRSVIADAGLDWSVVQHGAHAAYFFTADPPADGAGSRAADEPRLRALIRVYMANRGIWESGWWLGPTVSVAHEESGRRPLCRRLRRIPRRCELSHAEARRYWISRSDRTLSAPFGSGQALARQLDRGENGPMPSRLPSGGRGSSPAMKLAFAPIGILAGLLAGFLAQKGFERLWAIFDETEPPEPNQRDASYPKLVVALVVEGAIFRLTKGMVDHGVRSAFARMTGSWPGEQRTEA